MRPIYDTFDYEGQEFEIHNQPFQPYIERNKIVLTPWSIDGTYIARWEFANSSLFLTYFYGNMNEKEGVTLHEFFPSQNKVLAEWFSGEIKISSYLWKRNNRMGETNTRDWLSNQEWFSNDIVLIFEKGILKDKVLINHAIPRTDQNQHETQNFIKKIFNQVFKKRS